MRQLNGTVYSWQNEFGDNFVGKKVLVTGATGFIGGHLCEALVALGAEVHGISRTARAQNLVCGCKPRAVDLTDIEVVRGAVSEIQPQLIFHLAGMVITQPDMKLIMPMLLHNLIGTIHLLLAVTENGCERIIVAGSGEEPTRYSRDMTPTSPYAVAKASASMYARMFKKLYDLPVVVVRLFMTYGPRQAPTKVIPYTTLSLLSGKNPNLICGSRRCDFIYVLDVVRGLLKAAIQPHLEGETIDLGTGVGTRIKDVVELLIELCGKRAHPVYGTAPNHIEEIPLAANKEKTRRLLDWKSLWSLREGLIETVAWYRAGMEKSNGKS